MNRAIASLVALIASGAASAYPVVTVDGVLDNVADGTFDVVVEVSDDNGDVIVTETVPSLVIVGGLVSVDVDLGDAAAVLEGGEVLSVTVNVGELTATTRLGSVLRAIAADSADVAEVVIVAERLGDIPAASLVQTGAVAGVDVAFANITGLPAGIADGDDGNVFTVSGLVVSNGGLEVAPGAVTSARIIDGTMTSLQVKDAALSSTHVSAIATDKLAAGTLSGRNFADDAFAATDVAGLVIINQMAVGCTNSRALSTATICFRASCGTNSLRDCTTNACEDVGTNPSTSTRICSNSAEGIVRLGRVIQ